MLLEVTTDDIITYSKTTIKNPLETMKNNMKIVQNENNNFKNIIPILAHVHPCEIPALITISSIVGAYRNELLIAGKDPTNIFKMPIINIDTILTELAYMNNRVVDFGVSLSKVVGYPIVNYAINKGTSESEAIQKMINGIEWPVIAPGICVLYHVYMIMRIAITKS